MPSTFLATVLAARLAAALLPAAAHAGGAEGTWMSGTIDNSGDGRV